MLKYHKLISFVTGLLFLLVMQRFATPQPVFRFLLPAFFVYAVFVSVYNQWYLRQIEKYNFWIVIRQLLLLVAGFGLFLILPSENLRGLFLVVTVGIITFFQIILGNLAENLLINETLLIAFGLFFSFAAFYQYTPSFGTLYVMGVFFSSSLLARCFYEFVPKPNSVKIVASLMLGLFCSQIFWALNFLPLHFSALGLILLNIFYFCLILNYYNFFHILNFKKVQFHFLLILLCSGAVLLVTPWRIIR